MKISVKPLRGRLRIRWWYHGKDFTLTPGLSDTKQNRAYCQAIANKVLADCLMGEFDESLSKYKPWTIGYDHKVQTVPTLFVKFMLARKLDKGLKKGSLSRYESALSHLARRLDIEAHKLTERSVRDFIAAVSETASNRTLKEYLMLYRACFDWAQGRYQVPEVNPWLVPLKRVRVQPKPKVQPFTQDEVRAIIAGFQNHPDYCFYADFTSFLFGTGCRPGEAIALRWQHLSPNYKTAWIGFSHSHGELKSTKTGKDRTVLLSESIQVMLRSRQSGRGLVFPSKSGGFIDIRTYRRRAWKTILDDIGLQYRKPYITRHTAISLALEAGADPTQISEQTGHSLKTLLENYAHVIRPKPIFTEVG